jgi:NTE family protein
MPKNLSKELKTISLALQGGGTHGAFTWGVLDTLLRCPDLRIDAISGTSAGAVNAAVLLSGWKKALKEGHPEEAAKEMGLETLAAFWQALSTSPVSALNLNHWLNPSWLNTSWLDPVGILKNTPWDPAQYTSPQSTMPFSLSPGFWMADWATRIASPYEFNPTGWNLLKTLLERFIAPDVFLADVFLQPLKTNKVHIPQLFVSATQVESGAVRVFEESELSSTVLMASACLPFLFQAVEIEGHHYWDGGYTGNPALLPLIQAFQKAEKKKQQALAAQEIVIIAINPTHRNTVPTQSRDILNRMHEISFNSSLAMEIQGVKHVNRWFDDPDSSKIAVKKGYHPVNLHCIDGTLPDTANLAALDPSSKWQVDEGFLTGLFQAGKQAAQDWLQAFLKPD